jgi:3-oxoacyl-(acyl-carrier-protein) synthase
MDERIAVTAVGIVSALGIGTEANLNALRQSSPGLRKPVWLRTIHSKELVMGEVDYSNDALSALLQLPTGDNGYTRTTLLAITALNDLLQSVPTDLVTGCDTALINANTVGGMSIIEDIYQDLIAADTPEFEIKYIDTQDCAESTYRMRSHFGMDAFATTLSTACSSSANALMLGARMIRAGLVERAICGGCDALSRFTLNGFLSLKNVSRAPCRPFDQDRTGLNIGEGAGYVLLEKESAALARGATILAVLSGYANTNDAHHPTAPSPEGEGAYRTMAQALSMAGVAPCDIGYVNAHGTATENNDVAEAKAMHRLFSPSVPHFSSTKCFTGHTLAAAGVIEAIFSVWCLQAQCVLPTLNFENPMAEVPITPVTAYREHVPLKHVLSNSFGFGGSNVSLIFSKA